MQKLKSKLPRSKFWLLTPVVALLFSCFMLAYTTVSHKPLQSVGTNEQLNFQGRLLNSAGAVVPDGTYNIRFKIYQDGDGVLGGGDETLKWTETRDGGNKVLVKNGYFSVYLGSVTALTGIDWNQSVLWLSVDIGGTGAPSYDGEMTPFNRLGSTPYALNSKQLGGIASTGFVQLGPSAAQTDNGTNNSIFLNKTNATGNILQLQKNGSDVFNIANSGAIVATYGSTSSTAATESAHTINLTDTGAVTTGTDDTRGLNLSLSRTGASGTAVVNTFGVYSLVLGDTGGTSTVVGLEGVAGGADVNYGTAGAGVNVGSGQTEVNGLIGSVTSAGFTGTTTSTSAIQAATDISTAGTYVTSTGLLVKTTTLSGGGAITTNYGAWIQTQSVGGSDYGLRVDTADTQTLWIAGNDASATTAAKGIAFGSARDVTLYRGAANTLQTDGDLQFSTGGTRTIKLADSTTGVGNTLAIAGAAGQAAGNNAGGQVTLTGGTGSNSTGLGTGGAGGAVTIAGGTTNAADWVGNVGGAVNINGGSPTSSVVATVATGGAVNINGGTGGSATGFASSGAAAGGAVAITAGSGGTAAGGGNQTGGAGANVTLTAGSGGTSIGSAANANGGSITLQAGSAGTGGGGAAGTVGNITLQGVSGSVINVATNAAAQTVNIGNGTGATAVSVLCGTGVCGFGNNAVAHSTVLGSTTGASITYIQTGTAGMNIGNDGVSNTIRIGNASADLAQTIIIGNNTNGGASASVGLTLGSSVNGSFTTIHAGSVGLNLGSSGVSNTIQMGNTTGAVAQTINIGNNSTASSTNNVNIGSSVAGTVAITGPTTVTGRTSGAGTALTVSNSTSTGSIAIFNDNSSTVFSLADGGAALFKNQTNVATAFQIQDTGSASLFTVDTTTRGAGGGNLVKIGNSTGTDGALTVLQLDATTADPTSNLAALNGGLFYDSSANKVKIIENGTVKTVCNTTDAGCGAGGATTLQSAYNATSGNTITATDARDLLFTFADTATDPNFLINLQCVTSCGSDGRFAVQSAGTDVLTVAPTGTLKVTKHSAFGATGTIDTCTAISGCSAISSFEETFTSATASGVGIYSDITLNPSATNTSVLNSAGVFVTQIASGNAQDFTGFFPLLGIFTAAAHNGSGTVDEVNGSRISLQNTGGGIITDAIGQNIVIDNSSGTIGTARGISTSLNVGTATTAYGISVGSTIGTITDNYGIKVDAQTAGTADYGIAIEAADTQTLWLSSNANNTTAAAGIAFGSTRDTNLYRSAAATLKTDGNFQVGDASKPANVDVFGDLTKKGVKKQTGLTNIKDIFVYDTTRDSDAGAWTTSATSQGLSWYTETKDDGVGDDCVIATDDRCDGSRFPQKAILVTTTDGLYIFDAADYKMFMKFTQAGTYALGANSNNDPSGVFALNGVIYVGTNGTSGSGLYAFDFTTDRMFNYNTTDRDQGDKDIANRNTAVTYATDSRTSFAIANNLVNDVHGAVISGSASAVAATTIPQHGSTFIVAATDASASVINMSNSKVLDYADTATDDVNQVWLTKRGILYLTNETLAQVERYNTIDTDAADQITPDDIFDEAAANLPNLAKTAPTISTSPDALQVVEQNSLATEYNATTITSGDVIYVGHSQGLTEIHDVVTPSATNIGWSKYYKSTGETNLMSGTPRGMFGFDNVSGDITDATIRNNVLEPKGTPTYRVNGVHGTGMRFNGTSQYACSDANNDATCDTDTDFDAAAISFTVEAWFRHSTTVTGTDTLIDHTYTTTPALGAGYRIYMNSSGNILAGIDDDAVAFDDDIITSTGTFNDGQWHHLVFERVSTALTNPAQAIGTYLYIDGRSVGADTTIAATTLGTGAILGIGADCSVGAACGTGANFWDGDIDDVYISMGGATSSDSPNAPAGTIRRKFQEGKSALGKPSTVVTDATAVSSTTIGDSGEAYVPNAFVGTIVEITGGTGVGQTRRVVANSSTTLTVSPAWTTTPDTTSDYEVIPEQLYGDADSVTSLGITDNDFLGKTRTLFVGTTNAGGGGVTVFQGYGTPSASNVYHTDAGVTDDFSNGWSGTNADNIQTVDARSGIIAIGSQANLWFQRDDRNIDQTLDQIINDLASIRQEMTIDGLNGNSSEFSNVGTGADLAERYSSFDELTAGDVVSMEKNEVGSVKKSSLEYDPELLGIVATEPAITIGPQSENSHPIALSGRVPVKVMIRPGESVKSGDRITSSSFAGFGMKATVAGRVLGTALEDLSVEKLTPCPAGAPPDSQCGVITVFVNLVDFNGSNIELSLQDFEDGGLTLPDSILDPVSAWVDVQDESGVLTDKLQKSDKLIRYLLARKQKVQDKPQSEVLTDRLSAFEVNSVNIFAKDIYAGTLTVDRIKANKIEGLEILTDKIGALSQQVASSNSQSSYTSESSSTNSPASVTFQAITVKDLSVNGTLFAGGGLKVAGPVEFLGNSVFHKLVTFVEKTIFQNDVEFQGKVAFNNDTGGFAIIHPGQQEVEVKFEKPYAQTPVVNITRKNGIFTDYAYKDLTPEGFKIILEEPATQDIEFAWSALQVKDVKTIQVPVPTP